MPKLHKKSSKRLTCRLKYKRIKKIAAHHKKLRKEAKKNPKSKRQAKDPGVPNSAPFKDEVLQEAEQRKQRAKDLKAAQKASRSKLQLMNRDLESIVQEAEKNDAVFHQQEILMEDPKLKVNKSFFKSYFRDLKQVVDAADVVLEVLDARDPLGCRCPQIEELVIGSGKKLVLVLNKIDLIPRQNLDEWLKYLRQSLPTVAFKASTQCQSSNLSQSKVAAIHINKGLQESSTCVGASFLMKVLGNYCRNNDIQTFIKVGVVGFPNVGKSSVINSLKRMRACTVGSTPGLTKTVQEVSLDKHIKIIDSPGIVIAKDNSSCTLALRNAVRVENLEDVMTPAEEIVRRADITQLCLHYTVPAFSSCEELLCLLAKRLGKFKKGGIPNVEEGARRLINDWNRGVIKYYTHPPEIFKPSIYLSTTIVAELGKAFDISTMEEKMELDKAPQLFPSNGVAMQSSEPTEGKFSDVEDETTSLKPFSKKMSFSVQDSNEEVMDVDVKNITVSLDAKKESERSEVETKSFVSSQQINKSIKKLYKRNRRKAKKINKECSVLSDTMDTVLTI